MTKPISFFLRAERGGPSPVKVIVEAGQVKDRRRLLELALDLPLAQEQPAEQNKPARPGDQVYTRHRPFVPRRGEEYGPRH